MEQIAMVKSVLDNGMAQVAVQRETACGNLRHSIVQNGLYHCDLFQDVYKRQPWGTGPG